GEVACVADCNGDFGGTAFLDDCDICVGGNTGLAPCTVGCDNNVVIEFATDNNAADVSWSITAVGAGTPSCSGSNLPNNQPAYVTDVCCLSDGCYRLVVTDAGGDGIAGGGYVLRMAGNNGMRIIDNSNNFTVGSSSINTSLEDGAFCLPLGGVELLSSSCDKYFWANGQYIVCNEDAEVAADFNGGGVAGADSGYDFWFYNPNGGYSFIRERRHNVSDNFANIGSPRTCHMKVNNWATANHIPDQMNLNVRVRGVVNGVASSWGPACRFARNEALAICTPTKLFDIPGYVFYSCGVTRQFVTSSSQRLYARPVSGATQYQFRFSIPGEGVLVTRTANNYYATLGWTNDVPLVDGNTYDVEVRAFKGGIWCIWGETCQVTICNAPPCGMEANGGQQNVALDLNTTLSVWPNPNQGDQVHVNIIGLQDGVNKVTVDLFDLTGKRVISRQFAAQDGNMNTVMDLNGSMNSGMYMLRITAGEKVFTERLVIQH
ncbi:MAG TPA: T9SS type A sorting domain-containing protein, partial [Flavobacteriales bacterium]|nr:T9SS type A sorting domain-containing protein [Flavobacteriales bacterium]